MIYFEFYYVAVRTCGLYHTKSLEFGETSFDIQFRSNITMTHVYLKVICFYLLGAKYYMALLYQIFYNFIIQIFHNLGSF